MPLEKESLNNFLPNGFETLNQEGYKENFAEDKIAIGFERDVPDIVSGPNFNNLLDVIGKNTNVLTKFMDFIKNMPINNIFAVDENNQLVYKNLDEVGGGGGHQLFDTILKDHVLTYEETKGLALQGTYVYKEAIAGSRYGYPDFYNKCLEEKNSGTPTEVTLAGTTITMYISSNGHAYYDIADKSVIDTCFSVLGMAWWYGIDTENERVFLPRNNWFEQATGDVSEINTHVEAGLPNITGWFQDAGNQHATPYVGGAFVWAGKNGNPSNNGAASDGSGYTFDASRCSAVYGKSNTVQPNAVKKLLYICVGNTTNYEGITDVVNQGMEILEQVNLGIESRVALDGSNAQFPFISETYVNGTSGYNVYSNGYCEQWGIIQMNNASGSLQLLKAYKDTNFCVLLTCGSNTTGWPVAWTKNSFKTNSSFHFDGTGDYGKAERTIQINWKTCGYVR